MEARRLRLALLCSCGGRAGGMEGAGARRLVGPQHVRRTGGQPRQLQVLEAGLFRGVDVTAQAVGVIFNPGVARFDQATGRATRRGRAGR